MCCGWVNAVTEKQWACCTNPAEMLQFLRGENNIPAEVLASPAGRSYDRKSRLFAVACCRRLWPLLHDPRLREVVLTAERHADGRATDCEMKSAVKVAHRFQHTTLGRAVYTTAQFYAGAAIFTAGGVALAASYAVAWSAIRPVPPTASPYRLGEPPAGTTPPRRRPLPQQPQAQAREQAAQCALLRDIFGPLPFRPPTVPQSLLAWNGGTIVKMAQVIYDEYRFEDMPVLADALQEAGCEDHGMLQHCRHPDQPHARGCWVLDLLLPRG